MQEKTRKSRNKLNENRWELIFFRNRGKCINSVKIRRKVTTNFESMTKKGNQNFWWINTEFFGKRSIGKFCIGCERCSEIGGKFETGEMHHWLWRGWMPPGSNTP